MVLRVWREGMESPAMRSLVARMSDCIREAAGRRPERTTVDSEEGMSIWTVRGRGEGMDCWMFYVWYLVGYDNVGGIKNM